MNIFRDSLILCIITIIFPGIVLGQDPHQFISFDKINQSVVYLEGERHRIFRIPGYPGYNELRNMPEYVGGIGFLIRNNERLFLATAAHVAKKLKRKVKLISTDPSGFCKAIPLNHKYSWKYGKTADVGVLRLDDLLYISEFLHRVLDVNFLTSHKTCPASEIPLAVIGFPIQLGVKKKFSPICRETHASSGLMELPRADTKELTTFFILKDPIIDGYSGAPVFTIQANQFGSTIKTGFNATSCIGIIHGSKSDRTGGKLGLVTPAKYVYEMIE